MATVLRRKDSKYWCAVWRDAHGKQIWRSTKQTDRIKALADALDYERADKLSGAGSLLEVQARKIVNDIMERGGISTPSATPSPKTGSMAGLLRKKLTRQPLRLFVTNKLSTNSLSTSRTAPRNR